MIQVNGLCTAGHLDFSQHCSKVYNTIPAVHMCLTQRACGSSLGQYISRHALVSISTRKYGYKQSYVAARHPRQRKHNLLIRVVTIFHFDARTACCCHQPPSTPGQCESGVSFTKLTRRPSALTVTKTSLYVCERQRTTPARREALGPVQLVAAARRTNLLHALILNLARQKECYLPYSYLSGSRCVCECLLTIAIVPKMWRDSRAR